MSFLNDTMSKNLLIKLTFLMFFLPGNIMAGPGDLTVISLNIRFDNPGDGINAWPNRKELVAATLSELGADLFGMQEVLKHQREDLARLMPGYGFLGVGRDDGKDGGESCTIGYRTARLSVEDWGTIWLSATPEDTGSTGWDAALPRIATWVIFSDRQDQHRFFYLNTHFDHMGQTARLESARLIHRFVLEKSGNLPVIITGDFNCTSGEPPYRFLTGQSGEKTGLRDASLENPVTNPVPATFNDFGNSTGHDRIDFIFVDNSWEVIQSDVLMIRKGDIFISDHYPVKAVLKAK